MRIKPLFKMFVLCTAVSFFGCKSDKEDDVKPNVPGPQTPQCVTDGVTFAGAVTPILSANCYSCHSTSMASGGVVLDTYAGARAQALNGKLMGTITHAAGFSAMPQGGAKLSDCNIAKIKKWVDDGAPNN